MTRLCGRRLGVLCVALSGALGCAALGQSSVGESGDGGRGAAYRIAVAPVTLAPQLERQAAEDLVAYAEASTHVGHYLAEALLERGYAVVPARDSEDILSEFTRSHDLHRDSSQLARLAVERLGVDALLVVELTLWAPRGARSSASSAPAQDSAAPERVPLLPNPREGGGAPPSPAAVGLRATLHGGSDGLLLWSGEFSERQASFFESPWRSLRYPGRGTRWLSVTDLARWGARRLAAQIPPAPGQVEQT